MWLHLIKQWSRASYTLLFGVVCLLLLPARADAYCKCYYNQDCQGDGGCGVLRPYGSRARLCSHVAGQCKPDPSYPNKLDGLCVGSRSFFSPVELPTAALACSLWLRAYEVAGSSGGGPPDSGLVAQAYGLGLSSAQNEDIRIVAHFIQALYLGLDSAGGDFTPSLLRPNCDDPLPPSSNGFVGAIDSSTLAVGVVIREAIVGELRSPGRGVFYTKRGQIPSVSPQYLTFGRCEFPHPPEHGHPFPYPDGISCLAAEAFGAVSLLLGGQPVPSLTTYGLIIFALLLFGSLVWQVSRKRRLSTPIALSIVLLVFTVAFYVGYTM